MVGNEEQEEGKKRKVLGPHGHMERCENVLHSCRTSLVDSPLLLKISLIFRDVSQITHTCGRCEEETTIYLYYSVAPPTFAHGLVTIKTLHCSVNHPCYLTCSKLLFCFAFFTKRVFPNLSMFFFILSFIPPPLSNTKLSAGVSHDLTLGQAVLAAVESRPFQTPISSPR